MAWIHEVPVAEATGHLKKLFDAAIERAGRVWRIIHVQSLNPSSLEASTRLYTCALKGRSPLSRVQREMLATVVSAVVGCRY
jgi:alkylhydroperoxidase family enzyme